MRFRKEADRTVPLNQLQLGAVIRPYFQTRPAALAFWLLVNLASFGFEFIQWQQRRAEATKTDKGSYALLLTQRGNRARVARLGPDNRTGRDGPGHVRRLRRRCGDVPRRGS